MSSLNSTFYLKLIRMYSLLQMLNQVFQSDIKSFDMAYYQ